MKLSIVHGDLLDQKVEVIVNAWNRNLIPWWLLLPHGVSGAIKRRGGYKPFQELMWKGILPLGGATITSAGRLPFKAIIHIAGIGLLWLPSKKSVYDSVVNALKLASERSFRSIAFPLIGAGVGGLAPDVVLEIMQTAVSDSSFYSGEVTIVQYTQR